MSRVGKQPVPIPEGTKVDILADRIEVEGPKGKLTSPLFPGVKVVMEDNHLVFTRSSDSPQHRSMHGLCRTLASNAVVGVSAGFTKALEIVGVGYRAKLEKNRLELSL